MTTAAVPWFDTCRVFEHDDFYAIDKPAGIDVHSSDGQPGLVATLEQQWQQKLYLIHRLDKVTSGLLLLATNKAAAAELSGLFAERRIEKYYLAVSQDKPKKKQGMVKGDMLKSRGGSWKLAKSVESPAITQFLTTSTEADTRLFLLRPRTGKTHQLRVMMKSLGSPILGDKLYGGKEAERVYLHAAGLKFTFRDEPIALTNLPSWGSMLGQDKFDLNAPWNQPWPKVAAK